MYFLNTESFTCDIIYEKVASFATMAPWRSLVSKNYSSCYSTNSEQSVASCSTCISISSVPSPGENSETARRLVLGQKKEKGRRKRRLVKRGRCTETMRIRNASRLVVDGDVEWKLSLVRPRVISAADYSGFATENRKKEGGGERGKRKFVTFPRLDATLGLIKRKTSALFLCGLFWDAPSLLFEGREGMTIEVTKRERKKGDDSPRSWNETVRRRFQGIF